MNPSKPMLNIANKPTTPNIITTKAKNNIAEIINNKISLNFLAAFIVIKSKSFTVYYIQ